MSKCSDLAAIAELEYDRDTTEAEINEDGELTTGQAPGYDGDSYVVFLTTDDPNPRTVSWTILELVGVAAYGITFGGTQGVIGEGLENLFYLSDGRVVIHGEVALQAEPLNEGDVLLLWFDPVNMTAMYFLNGRRVV